jgi:hypothetical protein
MIFAMPVWEQRLTTTEIADVIALLRKILVSAPNS